MDTSSSKDIVSTKTGQLQFTKTKPDGTKEEISEAQVTEEILQHLRKQTQLVIGHAVLVKDIRSFLKANNVDHDYEPRTKSIHPIATLRVILRYH